MVRGIDFTNLDVLEHGRLYFHLNSQSQFQASKTLKKIAPQKKTHGIVKEIVYILHKLIHGREQNLHLHLPHNNRM